MGELTISIGSILVVLGMAVLGILFFVLLKAYEVLKQVKSTIVRNDHYINQSLESLPKVLCNLEEITNGINGEMKHISGTIQNLEEITVGVNEEMKHIKGAVRNIEETVEYAAAATQAITEDIVLPIGDILELLRLIKGIFIKDKKKGLFSR